MSKQRRRGKGPTRGRDRHDNKEPKKKSSQGRERKCYYCDEIGHIRPDCPKRKRYDKADRANVAQRDLSDTDGETVLATVEQRKATTNKEHTWYLDSGATCHVTCNQDWLHDYVDLTGESRNLILGDNFKCRIHGYGTLRTTTYVDGDKRKITFQKVLYAPELAKNLLSTARIASKGCKLTIDAQGCSVSDQRGRTILRARARGNMLVVPINPEEPTHQVNTVKQLPTLDELHRHFGHAGEKRLRTTLKALGLDVSTATLSACQLIGKQMLARASCGHVVVAPNGEQGVQAWEQQGPFHIVLMDYHVRSPERNDGNTWSDDNTDTIIIILTL
jgi:hypothetical protein